MPINDVSIPIMGRMTINDFFPSNVTIPQICFPIPWVRRCLGLLWRYDNGPLVAPSLDQNPFASYKVLLGFDLTHSHMLNMSENICMYQIFASRVSTTSCLCLSCVLVVPGSCLNTTQRLTRVFCSCRWGVLSTEMQVCVSCDGVTHKYWKFSW